MLLVDRIQSTLQQKSNKTTAASSRKYFKGVIEFRGLRSPAVTAVFRDFATEIKDLALPQALTLAEALIKSTYSEDKQMAIMVLNKRIKELKKPHLNLIGSFFDQNFIYDWGTCDSISSRVVCEIIKQDKVSHLDVLAWKDSDNVWKKRSSCVSFVKIARHGQHNDTILKIAETCIKHEERFVQLGNGWVLRELFLADPGSVIGFITNNYSSFSREGLRYAIEKMSKDLQSQLLAYDSAKPLAIRWKAPSCFLKPLGKAKRKASKSNDEDDEEEELDDSGDEEEEVTEERKDRPKRTASTKKRKAAAEVEEDSDAEMGQDDDGDFDAGAQAKKSTSRGKRAKLRD